MRRLLKAGSRPAPWRAAPVRESPCALSAEVAVGDVTRPEKLALALEGYAGVFSALSASTDRQAGEVEYGGNVNLLSAAREAGMQPFVYSSALLVDHPLARRVRTFREKTRFEEVLLGADDVSATVLRPAWSWRPCSWRSAGPWPSCQAGSRALSAGSPQAMWTSPPSGIRERRNRPPRARRPRVHHPRRGEPPPRGGSGQEDSRAPPAALHHAPGRTLLTCG